MYSNLPRGVARCQHIKVNGTRCDSPALKGKAYCYFHHRARLSSGAPPLPPPLGPNDQRPTAALPNGQPRTTDHPLHPAPLSPPADLFLLEDANSIQCALQWVLRGILAASMDHRQASLLLYGLQIAAANIKLTRFQPSYEDVVRVLPDEQPAQPAAHQAAPSPLDCRPEPDRGEPIPAPVNAPASSETHKQPVPSLSSADRQPSTIAQNPKPKTESSSADSRPLTPDSPTLPTDHCPPITACPQLSPAPSRSKRASRSPRPSSAPPDHRPLTTPRPALSLMFQREVRRHLARLSFPTSPESDPESK